MGRVFRFAQQAILCVAMLLLLMSTLEAQDLGAQDSDKHKNKNARANPDLSALEHTGIPQDWSTSRVIYTLNGSEEDMMKMRNDPRFLHSLLLHYMREHPSQIEDPPTVLPDETGLNQTRPEQASSNEDWSGENGLGKDVFGANTQELRQQPPWNSIPPLYPIKDHPIPIPLRPAKNKHSKVDWSMSLGPTGGLPIGETPAVYTASYASPSCSGDFIVYTINATPSTGIPGQANLVGLTNLYTDGAGTGFCSGTDPTFLFAYAIGSGGSPLSPVPSLDGTRIAWIENRTSAASYLHVTIWVANQGTTATDPVAPNGTFSNGACTPTGTSCDFALEYTASTYPGCTSSYTAGNSHSDLYVDYNSNTGFISANNGLLYHIKNIFSATTSPSVDFCIPVNTTFETAPHSAMSGPVYDSLVNQVFITDSETIYAYNVNTAATTPNFSLAASYTFGNSASNYNYPTGPGPLLDVVNGYLYVFSTYDKNGNTSVTQLPTRLASAVTVPLGPKSTNSNPILFYGAFDNNYFTYGPKSAASTLYSCGADLVTTGAQDLFSISFNAITGLLNTTLAMAYNTNVNPGGNAGLCSPITEFYDGTNDRIFVGTGQPGATSGADVVTTWNVNTQLTNISGIGGILPTYTAEATNYPGGTSGFAVDNAASTTAQAENIYFSTEQTGPTSTAVTGTGYNVNGIYTDGSTFASTGGIDDDGNAYSSNLLGTSRTWNGTTFTFGTANQADAWQNKTITLPSGSFSTLEMLALAVNGNLPSQKFIVTYTDNSTTTITQSVSDWYTPQNYPGESIAVTTAYRDVYKNTKDNRTFDLYGYSFGINAAKTVKSLTLPAPASGDNVVVVLAVALSASCGGTDYCAVKLTQSGLK